MQLFLTSPSALLASSATPNPDIVQALIDIKAAGNPVAIVSNQAEPSWFKPNFSGSNVQFLQEIGRQKGGIIPLNAKKFSLNTWDSLVLCEKLDDVQMGKNGGAIIIGATWSTDSYIQSLGINVVTPDELKEVVGLSNGWPGGWYFKADGPKYSVRVLSDLSSLGFTTSEAQKLFSVKVKKTVKKGGPRLMSLLVVTARSLLAEGFQNKKPLMWGIYPSSNSLNNDSDTLSDFSHRLRTTVSNVQMARSGKPLFIRHTHSIKRSGGGSSNRLNPFDQINTMHLNPAYKRKIDGRNVIIIDDCTTYGLSFGVAAAFLNAAGAKSVTGVALGKFGNQLNYFDIDINSDPFSPIPVGSFKLNHAPSSFTGTKNVSAQKSLISLIK